jgi:hypothetical protein
MDLPSIGILGLKFLNSENWRLFIILIIQAMPMNTAPRRKKTRYFSRSVKTAPIRVGY